MTYGDRIRSMNDLELAEFLTACIIPENPSEYMYISGLGRFMWSEDITAKLATEIKENKNETSK